MATDEDFAALAVRLIGKKGRAITVRRTNIVRDPTEPWKTASTSVTDSPAIGAFFDTTFSDLEIALSQTAGSPEGTRTSVGRKGTECYIAAQGLAFSIAAKDLIIDGSNQWEIVNFELIGPGSTPILYICTLGR